MSVTDKAPPTKVRVEEEERRIKDLQARLAELSKDVGHHSRIGTDRLLILSYVH